MPKSSTAPIAGGGDLGRLGDQLGDREALDARHRGDRLAHALAGDDEQRLDQVLRGQSSVSRTRSRSASVRRRRRRRVAGKLIGRRILGAAAPLGERNRRASANRRQHADSADGVSDRARCSRRAAPRPGPGRRRARPRGRRSGGSEREGARDHVDHVEQRLADRAGRDQREEGDRQREHEGEQRAGAHLARRRRRSPSPSADEAAPASRIAGDDQIDPAPVDRLRTA